MACLVFQRSGRMLGNASSFARKLDLRRGSSQRPRLRVSLQVSRVNLTMGHVDADYVHSAEILQGARSVGPIIYDRLAGLIHRSRSISIALRSSPKLTQLRTTIVIAFCPAMAFVSLPKARRYTLKCVRIPAACCDGLGQPAIDALKTCVDGLIECDIEIQDGCIVSITPAADSSSSTSHGAPVLNLQGSIVFPTFADLHTHIGANQADSRHPCCTLRIPPLSDRPIKPLQGLLAWTHSPA